jgi:hypothetical protein
LCVHFTEQIIFLFPIHNFKLSCNSKNFLNIIEYFNKDEKRGGAGAAAAAIHCFN